MKITGYINNRLIGHLAFLTLFILAIIFYLERTTFADSAYAVFRFIYYKTFTPAAGRITSVIPQGLPLMGIWMHLPLKAILILYSVSFIIVYYMVYLVIAYWFKNDELALAVPLVLMLGIKDSYYWIPTESHQGFVYCILMFGFLHYSRNFKQNLLNSLKTLILSTAILLLCFKTHPVTFFPLLFIMVYYMIDTKQWKNPVIYILVIMLIIITIDKVIKTPPNSYEGVFYNNFLTGYKLLMNLSSSKGFIFFRNNLGTIYLFPMLIFLATSFFYILKKQFFKLIFVTGSTFLIALIVFTTFHTPKAPFFMEKNLMPLIFLILLPFMKDLINFHVKKVPLKQVIIIGAFCMSVVNVVSASGVYRDRIRYINSLIDRTRKFIDKKFIIDQGLVDRDRLNVLWALAPETLILSSLRSPDSSRTIYLLINLDTVSMKLNINDPRLYLSVFWNAQLAVNKLDKKYFNLGNSIYRILGEKELYGQGSGGMLYVNRFESPGFRIGSDSCRRDSSGNKYFVLTSQWGPGFIRRLYEINGGNSTFFSASIRIYPLEELDPGSFSLVISHENGQNIKEYYFSPDFRKPLRPLIWKEISVSGLIHSPDTNDVVKIYFWNRARKQIGLDDMMVTYNK